MLQSLRFSYWRLWLAGLLIAALALRGVIPAGFMPQTGHAMTGLLPLTICSGYGSQTVHSGYNHHRADPGKTSDHGSQTHSGHEACPFAASAIFTFTSFAAPLAIIGQLVLILALTGGPITLRKRKYGNASSRSPPALLTAA